MDKRWWKGLECSSGIRNRGAIQQLRLRKERTADNGIRERNIRHQLQLESKWNVNKTFRETLRWRSQREYLDLQSWFEKWESGQFGGVGPSEREK
jgi:hypothetical protein